MEQLESVDSRLMVEKIREITGNRRTTRSTIVKDKNGNILTEREVLKRREEYEECEFIVISKKERTIECVQTSYNKYYESSG